MMLKVGDVVMLKSGGPNMVVTSEKTTDSEGGGVGVGVGVAWFNIQTGESEPHYGRFPEECLALKHTDPAPIKAVA